jgi:predicted transposase YbfD/YdcC
MSGKAFIDHFSALEDPRQAWKVVYPLPEILLIVLCATLGGAEDFVEIARWGQRKLEFLRRLLPFARGIASHDTLNDVMNALPAALFAECFTAWVEGLREEAPDIVAIDGKTSRRARANGSDPLHLVSAWASRQRLVLGQEAVAEKSNEINAIPLLLKRLELEGALVTIDAMGCQTEIAKTIRGKGADYLLAFAAAVRAHWGIENRLHWVMDVVFRDDLMRLRTGSGPANMATIRHAALNIVKEIPDKASLKVRRKTLGWDDEYLLAALTQPNK